MDQIKWIKPKSKQSSFVSIQKDFINLSVKVMSDLGNPKHIRLGIVEEEKCIALMGSHEIDDLAFRVQKNRIIYCRSFLNQVRAMFQIDNDVLNRLKTTIVDDTAFIQLENK